jgi:glutamate---methylamine ligase
MTAPEALEPMAFSFADYAKDHGVRFFLVSFTDLAGVQRSKLVPAAAMQGMAITGAGFAGFATWLDMTPADPDMFAIPDPASLVQLPWKPEVAWVAADPVMGGKAVEHAPRVVLKQQLARAAELGYTVKTGVECEFFILDPAANGPGDSRDQQDKPCYDQHALMRRYDLIAQISDAMQTMGWGPYQSDHEDANGQFEMNWHYADALTTADRHAFFKYMVRSLAEQAGLRATFMPKPFAHKSGNGCHAHVSLWQGASNCFVDPTGELGLSDTAYHAIGGLLHHALALCALTNPTVNSFKRLNAPMTTSGATWSPNAVSYTGNNRTHMVRIPDVDRFELRLADGSVNPYLLQAGVTAAILDGIGNRRDPGPRRDNNMYTQPLLAGACPRLPANLLDALRELRVSTGLRAALGEAFVDSYLKIKMHEWNQYAAHISEWERTTTLDC